MKFRTLIQLAFVASLSITLPSCAFVDWLIYKRDVPQGNFLEQHDINKLRVQMTKEQVAFIIGKPVLPDTFGKDTWYYVYHFKSGRNAQIFHKELILTFEGDKLSTMTGDYDIPEDFNTPIEQ